MQIRIHQLKGEVRLVSRASVSEIAGIGTELFICTTARWEIFHRSGGAMRPLGDFPSGVTHQAVRIGDDEDDDASSCEVVFIAENDADKALLSNKIWTVVQDKDDIIFLGTPVDALRNERVVAEYNAVDLTS